MGGCRCTYRNCTVKSDKQTHMFHYPVFDKVRCHQWLINAQRLEFLNLKVSQLKNRVVCQHHFNDDQFMNFKKDKLIFDAVPTENGPFCDSMDLPDSVLTQDATDNSPLCLEDIENDQLSLNEKRANFSVKYGDFLNGELVLPNTYVTNSMPIVLKLNSNQTFEEVTDVNVLNNSNSNFCFYTHKVSLPSESNKKHHTQPMLVVPPFSNQNDAVVDTTQIMLDGVLSESNINKNRNCTEETAGMLHPEGPDYTVFNGQVFQVNKNNINSSKEVTVNQHHELPNTFNNDRIKQNNKKINIISEKKIYEPLPIKGSNFEPVSSSLIVGPHKQTIEIEEIEENKHQELKYNTEAHIEFINMSENISNVVTEQVMPVSLESQKLQTDLSPLKTRNSQRNKTSFQKSPNITVFKNKVPPERVAAIEEKRNFNKKLRDMIVFCLDELDDPDKNVTDQSKLEQNLENVSKNHKGETIKKDVRTTRLQKKDKMIQKPEKTIYATSTNQNVDTANKNSQVVGNLVSTNEASLPSDYKMDIFESRLKRMEEILLKKIDQNSQRIVDLKNSLITPTAEKKSTVSQTTQNEEVHKRQLYQEISKFLSPDANSLIYEELFINKYTQNTVKNPESPQKSPPKRRRRR